MVATDWVYSTVDTMGYSYQKTESVFYFDDFIKCDASSRFLSRFCSIRWYDTTAEPNREQPFGISSPPSLCLLHSDKSIHPEYDRVLHLAFIDERIVDYYEARVDTTRITNEAVYSLHHLVSYTFWEIVTSLLFFLSVTGYFTASYSLCALPWLLQPFVVAVAIAASFYASVRRCVCLGEWLLIFPSNLMTAKKWRHIYRTRVIYFPHFYWIAYCVSPAQHRIRNVYIFRILPSVLRQCKWQIIYLM